MKETDIQSHVIKVVRARGGAARKLSHRFNLGVCDLLIKLDFDRKRHMLGLFKPFPAMLLEVKLHYGTRDSRRPFKLDVTRPQQEFLCEFASAGMKTGVLSFLHHGSISSLAMAVFELDMLQASSYTVLPDMHDNLGRDPDKRDARLIDILENYAQGTCRYG